MVDFFLGCFLAGFAALVGVVVSNFFSGSASGEENDLGASSNSHSISIKYSGTDFTKNKHVRWWIIRVTDLDNGKSIATDIDKIFNSKIMALEAEKRQFVLKENLQPGRPYKVEMIPLSHCCGILSTLGFCGPNHYKTVSTDTLIDGAWKEISHEVLRKSLKENCPEIVNFQLVGETGVGKSETINQAVTSVQPFDPDGIPCRPAQTWHDRVGNNNRPESVTKRNNLHVIFRSSEEVSEGDTGDKKDECGTLRIFDPWGVEDGEAWSVDILKDVLEGNIRPHITKDEHDDSLESKHQSEKGAKKNVRKIQSDITEKMHVIGIVANAVMFDNDPVESCKIVAPFLPTLLEATAHVVVILTWADELFPNVPPKDLNRQGRVYDLKAKVNKYLGTPFSDIFLVQSLQRHGRRDEEVEKLMLHVLREAVERGKGVINAYLAREADLKRSIAREKDN